MSNHVYSDFFIDFNFGRVYFLLLQNFVVVDIVIVEVIVKHPCNFIPYLPCSPVPSLPSHTNFV